MNARRLQDALEQYARAGYDTLPLRGKDAFLRDWQHRAPREMWQHAPKSANIGIRCGGQLHLAVVDADNKKDSQTSGRVARFFAGLGLHENDYPNVSTPNAGRHFYIALAETRAGAYCNLSPNIGAGEFRFGSGAYVAAPPSQVGERTYTLEAGDFEKLPRVALSDVRPILGRDIETFDAATTNNTYRIAATPTPSRRALALLRGEGIEKYKSRSEHEQALLASLANSGFEFDAILSLFLSNPCAGKFAELYAKNAKNAVRWLRHSFENAQRWTNAHEGHARQIARAALQWANAHAWTGRTGAVDKQIYIAHATLCARSGRVIYAASARDLAELAGTRAITASKATHRLRALGLIVLEKESTFNLAHTFRLVELGTLSNYFNVRECTNVDNATHDAFRHTGLGKTAAAVWDTLNVETLTAKEIIAKTGRGRLAVNRALERMFQLQMLGMELTERGETWRALEHMNLDEIARHIGTFGTGARQRLEHERQRAARRTWRDETRPPKRGKR